ncbi:MAG: inorganic phosphate transporter [Candidatus Dormiibacterota bacterium]
MTQALLLVTIGLALVFDFTNGFHDTANAIATSVSTRALTPQRAVLLSAGLNLVGAVVTVLAFGSAVSNTIGHLLAHPGLTDIAAGLIGATIWNLVTWYRALPSSSTHAFIGGLIGAGIAASGGLAGVHWSQLGVVLIGLVASPPLGFALTFVLMVVLYRVVRSGRPARVFRGFRLLQILTGALVSYSHGSNDAQKSMAAMTLALLVTGNISHFKVPLWVALIAAVAIGVGTYVGGWRIIRTLGWRIYKLDPMTGMGAQLVSALVIQVGTVFGLPVSTTHVVTGSVLGAGAPRRLGASAWGVGGDIVIAWLLTIPASAVIGWVVFAILHTAGLR